MISLSPMFYPAPNRSAWEVGRRFYHNTTRSTWRYDWLIWIIFRGDESIVALVRVVSLDWGLFDLPDPQTQGLMTVESIDLILKL